MRMEASELDQLRRFAIELATEGGEHAIRMLGSAVSQRKSDQSPVTDADHAVQALILDRIARKFPKHAVFVEEHVADRGRHAVLEDARHCWAVDPIDGTRNFTRG